MNILSAYTKGEANRHKPPKIFDWIKAAQIIKDRKPYEAYAGLQEDWGRTVGLIFFNDKLVIDTCVYLSSTWATPTLCLDDKENIPCWVWASEVSWDHGALWPKEARELLQQ